MQSGDQHSARNSNAFIDVIILRRAIFFDAAFALGEHNNQKGCDFEERLFRISADRGKRVQPRVAGFRFSGIISIESPLFLFSCFADCAFLFGGADDSKVPWLVIGAVGRGARCFNCGFNDGAWNRRIGEIAAAAPR